MALPVQTDAVGDLLHRMTDEQLFVAKAQAREALVLARVIKVADAYLAVEEDLGKLLVGHWDDKGAALVKKGASELAKAQEGKIVQSTLYENLLKLKKQMGKEFGEEMLPHLIRSSLLVWSMSSKETMGRLQLKWSTDLVDKKAAAQLSKHHAYWIGNHYNTSISESLRLATKEVILDGGLAGTQAAKAYRDITTEYLAGKGKKYPGVPPGFKGTTDDYFAGVSNHVGTQARVFSRMESYQRVGITTYRIVAVLDNRTSDVCRMMHGQTFTVEQGMKTAGVWTQGIVHPEVVKKQAGWMRPADIAKTAGIAYTPGATSPKMSAKGIDALAEKGQALPPYHFRCRTDVISSGEYTSFPTGSEPKTKPVKPPKKDPPKPPPAAPTPPAKAPGAFPWAMTDMTPVQKSAKGMHSKQFFTDPNGDEWMFKPAPEGLKFRAEVEKLAADAARAIGVDTADVYVVSHRGKAGTIQRLFKDVKHDGLGNVGVNGLSQKQVADLQRQHVLDWLIGNNDGHLDNFLVLKNGKLVGIDRGQAFRYFKTDKLALDYNPNAKYGIEVFYNRFFAAARDGKLRKGVQMLGMDSPEIQALLKQVGSVSDDEWLAIWKPYIDGALKNQRLAYGSRKAFEAELLRRKNELAGDLGEFYRKILGEAAKPAPRVSAPAAAQGKAMTPVDAKFVKAMRDSKNRGRSILVSTERVENGNLLVYTYDDGTVVVEGKLRAGVGDRTAQKRLLGSEAKAKAPPPSTPGSGTDGYWDEALTYIKHVNYHLGPGGDGVLSGAKNKSFEAFMELLEDISKSKTATSAEKAAARYYKKKLKIYGDENGGFFTEEKLKSTAVGKKIDPYKPKPKATKPKPKAAPGESNGMSPRVKSSKVTQMGEESREIVDGSIVNHHGTMSPSAYGGSREIDRMIVATLDDGTEITYIPHDGYKQGQAYSRQGRFRIKVRGKAGKPASKEQVEQAVAALDDLGVNTRLMTKQDFELLYLRKNQFAMGWGNDQVFAGVPTTGDKAEQIEAMVKAFKKKLGRDPRKMPGYNPNPHYYSSDGNGIVRFQRFDISDADLKKANLQFVSEVTGSEDAASLLLKVIDGETGGLIATEEKIRRGIPISGMSPVADQSTGGAQFVFTRARRKARVSGRNRIVMRNDLARDTNLVSYNGDKYGRMDSAFKERNRAKDLKGIEGHIARHDNETLFKNEVPLEQWDHITVSAAQKKTLLAELKARGVTRIAGKPVNQFVQAR